MKKYFTLLSLAIGMLAYAQEPVAVVKSDGLPQLTVLETQDMGNGHEIRVVRDAKGRVYKQHVAPGKTPRVMGDMPSGMRAPKAASNTNRTFFESFEGYSTEYGLNWIPQGWSKINTEAHTPTAEQLQHYINNSWYVYESSNLYQEMTPDGLCEAFIHFGYEGNYGSNAKAQDEWLVTPEISLGENETLRYLLQADMFYIYPWDWNAWCVGNRNEIECNMQVMITDNGGESWKCLWDLEADVARKLTDEQIDGEYDGMQYYDFSVSLAAYAGKNVKIAFRYLRMEGDGKGNSMMVDRVIVERPGSPWKHLGTGTMADGWVIPNLTIHPGEYYDPADYVFNVEIYESTEKPGVYKIASPYTSEKFPFLHLNGNKDTAYDIVIDATNPSFVIVEPQISGFEHNNPGSKAARYAAPYYVSHSGKRFLDDGNAMEDIIKGGYASSFDAEKGVITIGYPEYGHMVNGKYDGGYSCSGLSKYPTVITLPESAPEPTWQSLGNGLLVDGFIYPGYVGNPKGHGWNVEIQQKSDQPGLYRMVNPYTVDGCPIKRYNDNTNGAFVVIDATDPSMVLVKAQYSGFSAVTGGEHWNFYIGNLAGMYVDYGYELETVAAVLKDHQKDVLANGVITFRDPMFGADNADEFGYKWQDAAGVAFPYPAKLYLPGATETPEEAEIEASRLELNKYEAEGAPGSEIKLEATVYPADVTTKTVNWGSSDSKIAKVAADGTVSLLAEGTVEITAACGLASATCTVTVKADSGIDEVGADLDAEAVYYTVEGIRVEGCPQPGLYVRVAGGKASKVVIR